MNDNLEATDLNSLANLLKIGNTGLENIGVSGFSIIMTVSLISSLLISMLYLKFYGSRATGSQIHRAFPLLALSVTGIFISIQFSLPLSLGLLGALSIVRFRTPIKEPEEIGFIMLVIAVSIAAATFSLHFLVIMIIFACIALIIQKAGFQLVNRVTDNGLIILTVSSENYQQNSIELRTLLKEKLIRPKMESVAKSADGSVISFSFSGIKSDDPVEIQTAISDLLDPKELNIYFNKQATL
ncbi:MAG: DUF4956 domain-containing protein [Arenicella sp.]